MAAGGQPVNLVGPDDIPGLQVAAADSFTRQTLGNYSQGQPMMYTEFGFQKLYVFDYTLNGEKARLEIYFLEDPPSALGLYSLFSDSCRLRGQYTTFSCKRLTRFSAALGPMYLNAYSLPGSGSMQNMSELLVSRFIDKNPQDTWFFPPLFTIPKLNPYLGSLKFTRGPVTLARGAPELTDLFDDTPFRCYSISIIDPGFTGTLARVEFPGFNDAGNFLTRSGVSLSDGTTPTMAVDGLYHSWYKINDTKLIYLESTSPDLTILGYLPERQDQLDQIINK
jgi:hypothetical protein